MDSRANISADYLLGQTGLVNGQTLREGGVRALAIFDRLNHAYFPTSGWRARLEVFAARTALGSDSNYDRLDLSGQADFSAGRLQTQSSKVQSDTIFFIHCILCTNMEIITLLLKKR